MSPTRESISYATALWSFPPRRISVAERWVGRLLAAAIGICLGVVLAAAC